MKTGIFKHIFWVTLAGAAFLTGCSKEDGLPGGNEPAAVTLNASVEALFRTTAGGDQWVQNDEVGVYILTADGGWPGGFLAGAENKKYTVSDASKGTLSPTDGQDIYYPQTGKLDIVAYSPYGTPETSPTWPDLDYTIKIDFTDQSDPTAIDLLWAKAEDAGKSKTPVDLQFNHLFSKITLNISPGKGFSAEDMAALAAGDVTGKLVTGSMTADLVTGMVRAVDQETTVSLYKNIQPASGYAATFSAIIASGRQDNLDITFTVNGAPYTCTLTHDDLFKAGSNYVYPVTVSKTGVTVGQIAIREWTVNDRGTGEAEVAEI